MITSVLNLSTMTSVTLSFDQYFRWYSLGQNEVADVDVRSAATGGAWVNVLRQQNASSANPDHKTVNITAQAAGTPEPVASSAPVALTVTASDSILGHVVSYLWSAACTGSLGTGTFSDASTQNPTWTAPVNATGTTQTWSPLYASRHT